MNKRFTQKSSLLPWLLLLLSVLTLFVTGCQPVSPETVIEDFYLFWGEQDYEAMYELLDDVSQTVYTKEHFRERYSNISRGIALEGIEILEKEIIESDVGRAVLSLTVQLETATVGAVPLHYQVALSREKKRAPWQLRWHPGLIFPGLDDESRVEIRWESARRGMIMDRNGQVLAGPRIFKEVGAVPGVYEEEESFVAAVQAVLGLSREHIVEKLHQPWVQEGLYVPLKVLAPAEEELVEQLLSIPGVMINDVERRYYPAGTLLAHQIGYVGEITAEELAKKKDVGYVAGDLVGKTGLEAVLEEPLAGKKGYALRIVGADGSEKALIAAREAVDGQDITLTIDWELQKCVAEALGEKKGAVVALEPGSGRVPALYSNPGFDPNRLLAGLTGDEWREWQEDKDLPFLNRALSAVYPPGSVFKPFTAAAAIAGQVLDPAEKMEIKGDRWQPSAAWGDYYVRRVNSEIEKLDLNDAMKYSDNIYFARAGLALGSKIFMASGERFGFGEDLPFTLPAARSRLARETIAGEAQLADSSFGQGEVLMTPLQMALLYSVFAGNGSIPKPQLILTEEPALWKENVVDSATAAIVHRALVEAVQGTNAPSAGGAIGGFKVAGKTGTAEVAGKDKAEKNICWYVTYGPADNPGIVVAVVVEEGTWAGTDAPPIGRAVLKHYLSR